jgi:hypothetical protein
MDDVQCMCRTHHLFLPRKRKRHLFLPRKRKRLAFVTCDSDSEDGGLVGWDQNSLVTQNTSVQTYEPAQITYHTLVTPNSWYVRTSKVSDLLFSMLVRTYVRTYDRCCAINTYAAYSSSLSYHSNWVCVSGAIFVWA